LLALPQVRDEPLSTPSSALIREPSFNYKILPEVILTHSVLSARKRLFALALSLLVLLAGAALHAQATGSVDGTILDVQGKGVFNAAVTVKNSATVAARTARADATGHYSVDGLPTGSYTVEASASGFATGSKTGVVLAAGQTQHASFVLSITSVAEQITVNAGIDSIAAQTAPSGGFIEERSAQSLISNSYIRNFTSPIADYGEIVQIVPGAFTISSDGVGLGQSKTYFRGFPMVTSTSISTEFPFTTPTRLPTTPGLLPRAMGRRRGLRPQSRFGIHHRADTVWRFHSPAFHAAQQRGRHTRIILVQHLEHQAVRRRIQLWQFRLVWEPKKSNLLSTCTT